MKHVLLKRAGVKQLWEARDWTQTLPICVNNKEDRRVLSLLFLDFVVGEEASSLCRSM